MKRYEALAEEVAASIRSGVLRPGDRLPSVRQTSESRHVSPSTVFQAYYLLEARGLIRARAKSGYYVAPGLPALPPEPETPSHPSGEAATLDVSARVFEILQSTMHRDVVPLGSAFPSPLLYPLRRLAKSMAGSVQTLDPRKFLDDLTPGNAALRRQIALRYHADGIHVSPEEIVITNGAMEALNLCLLTVARPGDAVIIESPCFYAALQSIERNGLRAIEVPTHPRDGIELEALARAIEQHRPAACWLMTTFQNPLGSRMPDEKKSALVELLAQHGVPLIEDDVYAELYFGDERPAPAKAHDRQGLVMHCGSFSKSLAPGYRVGWVAPGRYFREVARHKLSTTITTSAPPQAALASYLEHGGYERHLRQLRRMLKEQQEVFIEAVARHFPPGTRATRPSGGYFVWIELDPRVDALTLHSQALEHGISIAPGPIFSASRGFRHCIRLNYGYAFDEKVEAAVATLGQLVARSVE
ncbi:PLP-dependent aminotransferase family protein [Lysobacter niastensis]|uniref:PLP-dependent aminotransferase family protein n=1 Tax=Lysobacter niastensis TaxID=380629 RepID=A0ABS0B629_9GAMM|nr:PLP-dependent aminotransferase family protein [Lysobacter niastensis]MBF6024451.1 PLP-dependent aminotransferase family protein [Lysobacter niastensis]